MQTHTVELTNVSSLPLNAHLSLNTPFQLQFEQDGQIHTASEQVLILFCNCYQHFSFPVNCEYVY